jgi:CHAT domain-containing protein
VLSGGSREALLGAVRRYPQQARTWGETEILGRWGESSDADLELARAIGSELANGGDALLHDEVQLIDHSSAPTRRVIAEAHVVYRRGRILYVQRKVGDAAPLILRSRALFESVGSPMASVARYYEANVQIDENRIADGLATLRRIAASLDTRYPALAAEVAWTSGVALGRSGRWAEAIEQFILAESSFRRLNERSNAAQVASNMASVLASLGRAEEAWGKRHDAFVSMSDEGDLRAQENALDAAAASEFHAANWDGAESLLTVLIESRTAASVRTLCDAYLRRAYCRFARGSPAEATRDIEQARLAERRITDSGLAASAENDRLFIEALLQRPNHPEASIQLLSGNIEFAMQHDEAFALPALYRERARAEVQTNRIEAAVDDLTRSMRVVETRRDALRNETLRDAILRNAAATTDELIEVLIQRNAIGDAVNVAERARARTILDRLATTAAEAAPLGISDIARALPAATSVIEYIALPDRLFIAVIEHTGVYGREVKISRQQLAREVAALSRTIERGDEAASREVAAHLYRILIDPISDAIGSRRTLVVSAGEELESVPFAALYDRASTEYLVQRATVIVAPSASMYARAFSKAEKRGRKATVIGDPAFDDRLFPNLPRLEGALAEAGGVAGSYGVVALTREAATTTALKAAARDSDVIHIGAHAIVSRGDPSLSALLLAPTASDSGVMYIRDIVALRLRPSSLVVLAGCKTGLPANGGGSARSLAVAFLVARANSVVGTLWDIDDTESAAFAREFHRRLREASPGEALRGTQLSMLKSSDERLHSVRAWGAFQLFGTGQ